MEKQKIRKEVILRSVAISVSSSEKQSKLACVVVAYAIGNSSSDLRYLTINLPTKVVYERGDILSAIARAEKVRSVTYLDFDGRDKDIYVCRPVDGVVTDVVPYDDIEKHFSPGFAEIEMDLLPFQVRYEKIKKNKPAAFEFSFVKNCEYDQGSFEYAVINAYNACLLGRVFSRTEFQLETEGHSRVKYEVSSTVSQYVDMTALTIKPIKFGDNGVIDHYETDSVWVIDGKNKVQKAYRIHYRPGIGDYEINRI